MAYPTDVSGYVAYLVQTKTVVEIQALADAAATELASGDKITQVSFEGGSAGSQLFFTASDRLNACMTAISQLGGISGITPGSNSRVVFPNFGLMNSET